MTQSASFLKGYKMTTWLKDGERIDDLQLKGLKIIQNPNGFCFGIDAVLLSHFVSLKANDKVVEFGTGTGIIPILLSGKSLFQHITAFEIQKDVADMAMRSVQMNALEDKISIVHDNLKNASQYIGLGSANVVITNPPYMPINGALVNPTEYKAISRHEVHSSLEDIIATASSLLTFKGKFFMIHRPNRMMDIVSLCRKYQLEPKVIRMIHPFVDKEANIFLLMCSKGGKPDLKVLPPLVVYDAYQRYNAEIYDIYQSVNMTSFTKEDEE